MGVTRRQFLQQVGVAGGAGVLYGTMGGLGLVPAAHAAPFTPPRSGDLAGRGNGKDKDKGRGGPSVVVLGAGVAGLAAAYELRKAGYDVTVLEARDRPGGRNWTVRGGTRETDLSGETQTARFADGQYVNAGPARIPQHHTTVQYCRELGVELEPFVNQNADAYYYNESTSTTNVGALSGTRIRHRAAKADVYGYVSELLARVTDQGVLDQQLSASDKERLLAFLTSFGALTGGRYTGTGRRGYSVEPGAGTTSGTPLPPYSLTDVLASRVGQNFAFELGWDQAMMMFQPVGGMDRIPYAFERAVGKDRITYGAEVTSITNTATGVEVLWRAANGKVRSTTAEYCVCTIPPMVLKKIPNNFSAPVKESLAYAVGVSTGKIALQYGRRWWEEDDRIFGGITNTNLDLSTIWYPSSGYLGSKGVVVGYYNFGANAELYGDLPHAQRLARALDQGAKVHGPVYRTVESSFSVAWQKTRYSEGGWVSWPTRDARYERLLQPEGRTWFAGDHLSHVIAWQHGAFESARKAVTDLHARAVKS